MPPREHTLKYSIHSRLRAFQLRRLLPAKAHGAFLDVGCGLGYLSLELGGGYAPRIGLDSDTGSLTTCRTLGLEHLVQGHAAPLPFADNSMDLVLCSEVLEHLPDGVDAQALHELCRVLKPGGSLLITVPSLEGLRARTALRNLGHDDPSGGEHHYRQGYAWEDMRALIAAVPGLKVVTRRYSMFLLSELFMDLLKLVYLKKNRLKEHSDIMKADTSFLFKAYRLCFPLLNALFLLEDLILCPLLKGHILVLKLEKTGG